MMYNNKLVVSLKANGRILRENKDTILIPFGSEYSFLLKNLHTTRAVVNIFIDGDNIVEGGLVLDSGREVDLERYIKNGNLTEGNRFKFIERTSAIEEHRGVKLEDGLVRIEFQYEKVKPVAQWNNQPFFKSSEYRGITDKYSTTSGTGWLQASGSTFAATNVSQMNVGGVLRGVDYSKGESVKATAAAAIDQVAPQSASQLHDGMATCDWNDVGITVPGSKSTQKFQNVTMGEMETETHSMVIKLLGETPDNKPVLQPVTVERKPECVTCGKKNKAHAKFCVECGTALEIFA